MDHVAHGIPEGRGWVSAEPCDRNRHVWLVVRMVDGKAGAFICRDCLSTLWEDDDARPA